MSSLPDVILIVHLIGLALALGAATAKLVLLFRCKSHSEFVPHFLAVTRPLTKLIILGLLLLILSGVSWVLWGYGFTALLTVKVVMVGIVFILGPIIDNVIEPRFITLAPSSGQTGSEAFAGILRRYLIIESVATLMLYAITIIGVSL